MAMHDKEIKSVHPKGNQSQIFIGRTDAEAEAPILWTPDVRSQLIRKDPDVGKDWRQEEKGMTEDEMVGWHLSLDGCEFEWALGIGEGQGSLACCSPWGQKETELNWFSLHGDGWIWVSFRPQTGRSVNRLLACSRWEIWAPELGSSVGRSQDAINLLRATQRGTEFVLFNQLWGKKNGNWGRPNTWCFTS